MRIKLFSAAFLTVAAVSYPAYDKVKQTVVRQIGLHAETHASAHAEPHGAGHDEEPQGHAESMSHGAADSHSADGQHSHHAPHKILVTSPVAKDVTLTQQYVCQIHSRRHIEVRALESGYLKTINVNEGQAVKQGDVMFKLLPTLYQAKRDADVAEAQLAEVEYDNTKKLVEQKIVSIQQLKLAQAKLAKAQAEVSLAQAEVNFADLRAPFDGIVDRLYEQEGSLIEEGAKLTTLSDNSVMWVYFNVPESRYLEYQESLKSNPEQRDVTIQLKLANHKLFDQPGKIGAIEADFNNQTGNIAFRADFDNPQRLLRHGQTGTILIHRLSKDAIVIPQRATFEILAKKYAFVVDDDGVVRQREIEIENELDDIFIISGGLQPADKIILEGIRQVRDGDKVTYQYREPADVLSSMKNHAE